MEFFVLAACVVLWLVRAFRLRRVRPARGFLSASKRFRLFDFKNVIVADDRGTTEIDVIVVGNSGVFVVELKDFNAWIFGDENADKWTAVYRDKSKYPFQNPLRQNFRHIKALESRLRIPPDAFHSIVAFTGDCDFKTALPSDVIRGRYRGLVKNAAGIRLTDSDVTRICKALEELKASSNREALAAHVANLRARYSSTTTCPKCGAALVERRSRTATADHPSFLGCERFPRCRYTRKLDAESHALP